MCEHDKEVPGERFRLSRDRGYTLKMKGINLSVSSLERASHGEGKGISQGGWSQDCWYTVMKQEPVVYAKWKEKILFSDMQYKK